MISDQQKKIAREYCESENINITDEQLELLAELLLKRDPQDLTPE
jgi:hypothetical protein